MSYINPSVRRADLLRIQPGARVSGLTEDNLTVTVRSVISFNDNPDGESEVCLEDTTGKRWFVNTKYSTDTYILPPV